MGDILFIRVSAETFSEKDMVKRWGRLSKLAFPDGVENAGGFEKGVFALIQALYDGVSFSLYDEDKINLIKDEVEKLYDLRKKLDEALADQEVPLAKELTNKIEDRLDDAERNLR